MSERTNHSTSSFHGIMVCVGLLALGGVIVLTLVLTPTAQSPAAPTAAASSVPDRKLRFVACDLKRRNPQGESIFAQIRRLDPDYLLLQNVNWADVSPLATAMGLRMWSPRGGPPASWGNCVLSKQEILDGDGDRGCAVSVVDGKPFLVGSVQLPDDGQLVAPWQESGAKTIVLGGSFVGAPADDDLVQAGTGRFDALPAFVPSDKLPHERIFLSPGWSCVAGGVVRGNDLTAVWIDAASSAAATTPTTQMTPADE
jgi:hypothetical protein